MQAGLSELGLEYHIERTRSLEHARELAVNAAGKGEIAVALGGDGLVGAVAGALKNSDGVLGVLPGGRGNDFARVLGIPLEARAACQVLANGEPRKLDLGQIGRARSSGSPAAVLTRTPTAWRTSPSSYAATSSTRTERCARWPAGSRRALRSRIDGGEVRARTGYTVAAANSKAYGGGMFMAPDASLEDGLLDVIIVGHVPKRTFLRLLPTVFKGEHVRQHNVEVLRGREVEISCDRPFTMYADGDPIAELPVTVRVLAGAVRVMVPKGPMATR